MRVLKLRVLGFRALGLRAYGLYARLSNFWFLLGFLIAVMDFRLRAALPKQTWKLIQ